jgi:ATP-binding cassette subfamily B protein
MARFPFFKQADAMDCGPTCLRMISRYYGRNIHLDSLRNVSGTSIEGTNLFGLSDGAEKIGFRTLAAKVTFENIVKDAPLPFVAHWNQNHFVVVYKVKNSKVYVADPAFGLTSYTKNEFMKNWTGSVDSQQSGVVLLLEPTRVFYEQESDSEDSLKGIGILLGHIRRHKALFVQLSIALLTASVIQLIFPFLTQSIVDIGIVNKDLNFIYVVLAAQVFLFLGRTSIEFVKAWIPLHISTRINITIVSEFLIKLMRLPINYFNGKMTGDIMQRINDHKSVENLLSTTTLNAVFSFMNLIVFGAALAWYSRVVFFAFFLGTSLYTLWVILFLSKRRSLNYQQFAEVSKNQSKILELINGMQEIKLHNAERQKRWDWERIQVRLFKISSRVLAMDQIQSIGSSFINESKNIAITILSAKLVIDGEITLGMMLSISYMIGQLNSPVSMLINFVHVWQDAKIGMERIGEIHSRSDEEPNVSTKLHEIPDNPTLSIQNLSFRYPGANINVLNDITFQVPSNKITAIVGASGCGKTTLMKILLKFYEPTSGDIRLGNHSLNEIAQKEWRGFCGSVMQEGFIFNDTIANNVAIGNDQVSLRKLNLALEIANIHEFVQSLPMSTNTKIGSEGLGLSTGQKQRLLIARAVYKNPSFVIFDEATSSLDSTSEKIVMDNLTKFLVGRTSVVIAHRLSTVKHADQIVVLGDGHVLEVGNHDALLANKGPYYNLVKNQLQLEAISNGDDFVAA